MRYRANPCILKLLRSSDTFIPRCISSIGVDIFRRKRDSPHNVYINRFNCQFGLPVCENCKHVNESIRNTLKLNNNKCYNDVGNSIKRIMNLEYRDSVYNRNNLFPSTKRKQRFIKSNRNQNIASKIKNSKEINKFVKNIH